MIAIILCYEYITLSGIMNISLLADNLGIQHNLIGTQYPNLHKLYINWSFYYAHTIRMLYDIISQSNYDIGLLLLLILC